MQELELKQKQKLELELEYIPYTLSWHIIVGAIFIANTANRVYIYSFLYF